MKFTVIGAGAWGTAFAVHLARAGHEVALVPRREDHACEIVETRENREYLPQVRLPIAVNVTSDLRAAARDAEVVLLACPAQALRETAARLQSALPSKPSKRFVISLAKGLELRTHLRPSEVIAAVLPEARVGSLTGPTNALGVARGDPSAMVLATTTGTAA